jgi:hypothetical protein
VHFERAIGVCERARAREVKGRGKFGPHTDIPEQAHECKNRLSINLLDFHVTLSKVSSVLTTTCS